MRRGGGGAGSKTTLKASFPDPRAGEATLRGDWPAEVRPMLFSSLGSVSFYYSAALLRSKEHSRGLDLESTESRCFCPCYLGWTPFPPSPSSGLRKRETLVLDTVRVVGTPFRQLCELRPAVIRPDPGRERNPSPPFRLIIPYCSALPYHTSSQSACWRQDAACEPKPVLRQSRPVPLTRK